MNPAPGWYPDPGLAELAAIPAPTFALNFATLIRADKSS
jgi:hypothetical protein